MTSIKTFLLGAVMTGALFAPAIAHAENAAATATIQATDAVKAETTIKAETPKVERKFSDRGEKAFEESDKDKNGTISEEEFLARHKEKFKQIDTNSDGSLSKEEFAAHGEAMKVKFKERREQGPDKSQAKPAEKPAETAPAPAQ
jgi:Ca2+-binding EF-hand superfamily protein